MSDNNNEEMKRAMQTVYFKFMPSFLTTVFVVFAFTGNCNMCGLDKDYASAAIGDCDNG